MLLVALFLFWPGGGTNPSPPGILWAVLLVVLVLLILGFL